MPRRSRGFCRSVFGTLTAASSLCSRSGRRSFKVTAAPLRVPVSCCDRSLATRRRWRARDHRRRPERFPARPEPETTPPESGSARSYRRAQRPRSHPRFGGPCGSARDAAAVRPGPQAVPPPLRLRVRFSAAGHGVNSVEFGTPAEWFASGLSGHCPVATELDFPEQG
jgi:hypothetical protein